MYLGLQHPWLGKAHRSGQPAATPPVTAFATTAVDPTLDVTAGVATASDVQTCLCLFRRRRVTPQHSQTNKIARPRARTPPPPPPAMASVTPRLSPPDNGGTGGGGGSSGGDGGVGGGGEGGGGVGGNKGSSSTIIAATGKVSIERTETPKAVCARVNPCVCVCVRVNP